MNFIQPNFFIFLLIFVLCYRCVGQRARVSIGIVFSFYFYAYFSPLYSLLLLVSSLIDFGVSAALQKCESTQGRRWWLSASVVSNLGLLIVFKYSAFLWNSCAGFVEGMELMPADAPPMGISFFTFQTMSYTIDIYRGQLQPTRSFRHFLFYISFFPQLVAGPIVRASDFLPQISQAGLRWNELQPALWRFTRGFLKKTCLADALGVMLVDPVYANPHDATSIACWLAVLAYGLQLYLDFSGYSDMAIALGQMLGFTFPENFNYPYLAKSFSDFWKRWHMSLSSWLRDYLYISLGGNRQGTVRTLCNLMLTMLLGGLWHGAGWNFVIWGGLNGAYLIIEHVTGWPYKLNVWWGRCFGTFWVVGGYFFSLIFFRASSFDYASTVIGKLCAINIGMLMQWWNGLQYFYQVEGLLLLLLAASTHLVQAWPRVKNIFQQLSLEWRVLYYVCLGFCLLHYYPVGKSSPFIYFQF